MVGEMEAKEKPKPSPDYLMQLMNDKKLMSSLPNFCGIFNHLERLLDEEISRVRKDMYNDTLNGSTEKRTSELPDAVGPIVQLQEKLYVPVKEYPDGRFNGSCLKREFEAFYVAGQVLKCRRLEKTPVDVLGSEFNFVGRILGPRGLTAKQLEAETGCKIMVRGKGSMRDKKKMCIVLTGLVQSVLGCLQALPICAAFLTVGNNKPSPNCSFAPESFGQVFKHCPWPRIAWGLAPVAPPGLLSQSKPQSDQCTLGLDLSGSAGGMGGSGTKGYVHRPLPQSMNTWEEQNRGKPNWEHLNEDLHVLITVEDAQNRAEIKLKRAVEEVNKLLVPAAEGEDSLKKMQLMELAILNGTYRDANIKSPSAQAPRIIAGPAPVLPPAALRTPTPAGPTIMPLIRQIQTVMPNGSAHPAATATLVPPGPESAGLIYAAPYEYPYTLAPATSILEYPIDSSGVLAGAVTTKVRRHEMRVHPYQRVVTTDRAKRAVPRG
ncbi:hypothetical protein NFI96_016064, partial [Prochilodus magdalenae]